MLILILIIIYCKRKCGSVKETPEEKRNRLLSLAKLNVGSAYAGTEHSIAQAIASYNELEKTRNLVHEKLEEWYGIFFPELRLSNPISYAKFIERFGMDKKSADRPAVTELLGGAADQVLALASRSIGREPSGEEYEQLKALAQLELHIVETEDKLDKYLEASTKKLMPNITYLIDYKVAAELLARAGSLEKLALMPAGTIQLLGAEKALFKHIKFGSKSPKYGSIFKLQQVGNAGRFDRGRIARAYGAKLAIAARADGISKNFIADKLKEQLEETIKRQSNRPPKPGRQNNQHVGRGQQRQGRGDFRHDGNWHGKRQRRQ